MPLVDQCDMSRSGIRCFKVSSGICGEVEYCKDITVLASFCHARAEALIGREREEGMGDPSGTPSRHVCRLEQRIREDSIYPPPHRDRGEG